MFKDYTHLGIYLYILTFLQREIYNLPSHLKISLFILYFNLPVKSLRRQKKKKKKTKWCATSEGSQARAFKAA